MNEKKPYVAPFIRDQMKGAREEEILEASERLQAYLHILWGAFMRRPDQWCSDSLDRTERDRFTDTGAQSPDL